METRASFVACSMGAPTRRRLGSHVTKILQSFNISVLIPYQLDFVFILSDTYFFLSGPFNDILDGRRFFLFCAVFSTGFEQNANFQRLFPSFRVQFLFAH